MKAARPGSSFHWSASRGADSYSIDRISPLPGLDRVVDGLQGTTFIDEIDLTPGVSHAYTVTARNTSGSTNAQHNILVYPDFCDPSASPGPFTLTANEAICVDGEPGIPISWTASSGADDFYRYKVHSLTSHGGGGASVDTGGYSRVATAGVEEGQVNQVSMIASLSNNEDVRRMSSLEFIKVPFEVCGPQSLLPLIFSMDAAGITASSALFRASVRPNGSSSSAYFEWGPTASYGFTTPPVNIGESVVPRRPSAVITGLDCGAEYHYRSVATNAAGTSYGEDRSFVTDECDVEVSTTGVIDISKAEATLVLNVTAVDDATVWFEWGENATLGSQTQAINVGTTADLYITQRLRSLECESLYFYRAVAETSAHRAQGQVLDFYTGSCSEPNVPPSITVSVSGPNIYGSWYFTISASDPDDNALFRLSYSLGAECSEPVVFTPNLVEGLDTTFSWNPVSIPEGDYYVSQRLMMANSRDHRAQSLRSISRHQTHWFSLTHSRQVT